MLDYFLTTFSTFLQIIPATLAQSLILSFVVLGVMIPFRMLQFPDLTSEGAYPLGACVSAIALNAGVPPAAALLVGAIAGFCAGCSTAFIHLRFKIHTLLSGIIVTTMLYSINLAILGKSNLSVGMEGSIFDAADTFGLADTPFKIWVVGALVIVTILGLVWYLKTESGTGFRAVGANPDMAEAQGISVWRATIAGIGLAGAFSGFSGAVMTQSQGFSDVNMGLGILINGLAALIIGEAIVGRSSVFRQVLAPFVGSIAYYMLVSLCLSANMPPPDLKLATGLFVLIMLALPTLKFGSGAAPAREEIRE